MIGVKKAINLIKNLILKKSTPISLIIFLTNRCNARCPFCFIDFNNKETQSKSNELGVDEYLKIAKSIGKDLHHLNFTGGEPFLIKEFSEITNNFIKICKISSIQISSNGSYPKKIQEYVNQVCKKNTRTNFIFQFSIDSFPDEHDQSRGIPGLFEKTLESFEIIKKATPNCISACNLVVSEDNYNKILEIYDFLINEKKIMTINPIIVRDEGVYKIPLEKKEAILDAYKSLTAKILLDIKSNKIRGYKNFSIEGLFLNGKNDLAYDLISQSYLSPKFFTYCVAGKIFGVIKPDGSVYPCEILDKSIGNLHDYDFNLKTLWKTYEANNIRNWIKETKCNCHWECIYSYNILSNKKQITEVLKRSLKYF
jgi:radical SAM protein with 4Fe4S-binding SPASM domain